MSFKIGVRVMPRDEVLDSQGRTIQGSLKTEGFMVSDVKAGKYFRLELSEPSLDAAKSAAKKIAEHSLCNPLIEKYELEVIA
jgi:phosphoribosylformylglycinamidine synthase PurS subunit